MCEVVVAFLLVLPEVTQVGEGEHCPVLALFPNLSLG